VSIGEEDDEDEGMSKSTVLRSSVAQSKEMEANPSSLFMLNTIEDGWR
jgi:hypothetical protein